MTVAAYRPEPGVITMFSTSWCGYCRNLRNGLTGAGIRFREVDIDQDPAAAEVVTAVNGGNRTVPTVLFPDGSTSTNPSAEQVARELGGMIRSADPESTGRLGS